MIASSFSCRGLLLAGVSALSLAMMLAPQSAQASGADRRSAASNAATQVVSANQSAIAQTAAATRRAQEVLARTTQALMAIRTDQSMARAAALAATNPNTITVRNGTIYVSDGLGAGGLLPAVTAADLGGSYTPNATDFGSALWQGANLPTQEVVDGHYDVTVRQNQSKAILTWESFNVGANTTLTFDQQGHADWIALNRVDSATAPSAILGSVKADGQIYVINQNGVVFGGGSQVNTQSLIASSLALSNRQFEAGIMTRVAAQSGVNSGDYLPTFGSVPSTTNPNAAAPEIAGDVEVRAGAQITSGENGLVALFGPNVTNSGTIHSDGGQVLLAAGEQVVVVNAATDMVGVRAYVSALPNFYVYGNDATKIQQLLDRTALIGIVARNDGEIAVESGNVTMVGAAVEQAGFLRAVTTLEGGGTILLAGEHSFIEGSYGGISRTGGAVVFEPGSVTQVTVDRSSATSVGGVSASASIIRLTGQTITLETGSIVQAEAGKIDIDARTIEQLYNEYAGEGFPVSNPTPQAGATITVESGAILDVSGVADLELAMESNSVAVEVRANEVRDAPLQRDGMLLGETLYVDRRVSGVRDDGTIWYGTELVDANDYIANVPTSMAERATTGGSIVMHASTVDLHAGSDVAADGGAITYRAGYVTTTQLFGPDGKIYDVGVANPDVIYASLGGGSTSVGHGRWGNAETWTPRRGGLALAVTSRYEEGYVAGAAGGSIEIYAPNVMADGDIHAAALTGDRQAANPPKGGTLQIGSISASPPDMNFIGNDLIIYAAGTAKPTVGENTLFLTDDLLSTGGFSQVKLIFRGDVTVESDATVTLEPKATFSINGDATGNVSGTIRAAGGTVSISTVDDLAVGPDAHIDVSGQWTNEVLAPATAARASNAGSVSLTTGRTLSFGAGSLIEANAGATLTAGGKVKAGTAGSISLSTSHQLDLSPVTLTAYGVASSGDVAQAPTGGTLDLYTPGQLIAPGGGTPAAGATGFDPSYFSQGGFSKFALRGNSFAIADGVTLAPEVQTLVLSADYATRASAEGVSGTLTTPSSSQRAGVIFNIETSGDVALGAATTISTGIGGRFGLSTKNGDITVAGTIEAPAGSIRLAAANLTLASGARLLATGANRITTDGLGHRDGKVLNGGSVTLESESVYMNAGASIDVSGTSGWIDRVETAGVRPLLLASNGGEISITGAGLLEGTFRANAGGPGASGGYLTLATPDGSGGGASAQDAFKNFFIDAGLEISCWGYGSGVCGDGIVWEENIGIDWGTLLLDFGAEEYIPIVFTQAFVDALPSATSGDIVLSHTAAPPAAGGAIDLASYGLTQEGIDLFSNWVGDISSIVSIPAPQNLVVRPDSFASGGFASLGMNSGGAVRLDGVDIVMSQSISVQASIVNINGTSSALRAPVISLYGASRATSPGTGELLLDASRIDVGPASVRGYETTHLKAVEIMFGGENLAFDVDGKLVMEAGQIYPATDTLATVTATESIQVLQNGAAVPPPMSAGGKLVLVAPDIEQNGTLRAPFGQIVLDAANSLTLGPGSLTSVSGAGVTVLYGSIKDLDSWYFPSDPNNPASLPPEKRITLTSPDVDARAGAVIDVSGGGDLLAYQFVPGTGGSKDYLTYGDSVAIVPVSRFATTAGQRVIRLDGGNGIPAGDYVVLDANYALLPGAYRLAAVSGANGLPVYDFHGSQLEADGSVIVGGLGYTGGTDAHDQRSQAYRVSPRSTIDLRSEYKVWTANDYFSSSAFVEFMRRHGVEVAAIPRRPIDAGALQINSAGTVNLEGTLKGTVEAGARGALLDISASNVAIVGGVDGSAYASGGYLVLDAAQLSNFGAESILLGGTRQQTIQGLEVSVTATDVVVATDGTSANALAAPDIMLAARDGLTVTDGSLIEARGTPVTTAVGNIIIKPAIPAVMNNSGTPNDPSDDIEVTPAQDFGAFLRVSNGSALQVVRNTPLQTQGTLSIGAATLRGAALLLEATRATTMAANATLAGSNIDLTSGRISVGTPSGTPDGLILAGATLDSLRSANQLSLRSYSSIDFYGTSGLGTLTPEGNFQLDTLLLDSAAINGDTGAIVTIQAKTVEFANTLGGTGASLGGTGGSLVASAETIALGVGGKRIDGFDAVSFAATSAIVGRGSGSVDFGAADVAFTAPRVTGESGASQDWTTSGGFVVSGTPAGDSWNALGARLGITAAGITQSGLLDFSAGALTLRATGGDVVLASGSVTRGTGYRQTFYDQFVDLDGGTIALIADSGEVWLQAGALIDVSAAGAGDAGSLSVTTPQRAARLDGELRATAGATGGNFALDTSTVPDFAALAAKLGTSGFDGALSYRIRTGDVVVDGATRAESFSLSAEGGSVTVSGTVDASGGKGGKVRLAARNDLTLTGTAVLNVDASDAGETSGLVELSSVQGLMDLQAGSVISAVGGRNGGGDVNLRFLRNDATGAINLSGVDGTIVARRVQAEAYRSYDGSSNADAVLTGALADAQNFMTTYAAGHVAALGKAGDAAFHLVPGVELASVGDLTLSGGDLHTARYGDEAGVLTLRAEGNLAITGTLSDGFSGTAVSAAVLAGQSWSYRLVGGADAAAADVLAVNTGGIGDVSLANGVMVRTGTGSISVAAGRDVVLTDRTSAIYTAGELIADPSLGGTYTGNLANPSFTQGGGNVSVAAANDIRTVTPSEQMIVDWLWREGYANVAYPDAGGNDDGVFLANQQTAWWVNFSAFEQGIAALGGGNVSLNAGRDISNVSASTVTQGRVGGGRTAIEAKQTVITGGGDLTVRAGRDILGGVYYVDNGSGLISANGKIDGGRSVLFDPDGDNPTPAYLTPVYTVAALGNADLTIRAGGNITLGATGNPTQWEPSYANAAAGGTPYFSTYGDRTSLTLESVGGDVTLENAPLVYIAASPATWGSSTNVPVLQHRMAPLASYAANTRVVAATGSINVMGGMIVMPAPTGNLDLWAEDSVNLRMITSGGATVDGAASRFFAMSPVDPDKLGTIERPRQYLVTRSVLAGASDNYGETESIWGYYRTGEGSYRPDSGTLHDADREPSRIYAKTGDIVFGYASSTADGKGAYFAEAVQLRAGRDIVNAAVRAQNNSAADLTVFQAGRDINLAHGKISVDGPGYVLVEAGRDVYLGSNNFGSTTGGLGGGIETAGNGMTPGNSAAETSYADPNLPAKGADLTVLAGMAEDPQFDAFTAAYLDPATVAAGDLRGSDGKPVYWADLVAFMRQASGDSNLPEADVLAAFNASGDYRKIFLNRVLSEELRQAGRETIAVTGLGYERGYNAIALLYPGAETETNALWQGDIIMEKSMIRTAHGGDLDIVAPGGFMQVSALSSDGNSNLAKVGKDGILTINGGDIRIFTGGGTIINKSRVLTARGGDITIWATWGDIDAGKGKKTTISVPSTSYKLTPDGGITYALNPSLTGSGISTQLGAIDAKPSDVDLIAPKGTVNAGDAGISSSNDVYISAKLVLGADNIHSAGQSFGVPKPEDAGSGSLSVDTGDQGQGKSAADAVNAISQRNGQRGGDLPSIITVEVIGYGGGEGSVPGQGNDGRLRDRQGYNRDSAVQFSGLVMDGG